MISECGSSRLKRKQEMSENCTAAQVKDLRDMNADVVTEDELIMKTVREITRRGNNAEIRMRSNGRLAVYEVKKRISVG